MRGEQEEEESARHMKTLPWLDTALTPILLHSYYDSTALIQTLIYRFHLWYNTAHDQIEYISGSSAVSLRFR